MAAPSRKILLVVTVGGFTHAAPVFELGKVLADRGHEVEFATFAGQEKWTTEYPFISRTHLIGPGPSEADYEAHYLRMRGWDVKKGFTDVMDSKYMFDSYWTETYQHLKTIMEDELTRPDMLVADFFVDAAKDMLIQFNVPIAMVWSQMPYLMLPCSYIPGQPGFQVDMTLTSEHASICSRIRNEFILVRALPTMIKFFKWTTQMRRNAGVNYPLPITLKPDYLLLVNSFFGLETPKDLPPLVAAIGPILSDEFPPLDTAYLDFLSTHNSTIYIALGSHVILRREDATKIVCGILAAVEKGLINGVIWAVGTSGRQDFDLDLLLQVEGKEISFGQLMDGQSLNWVFPTFAPQRAILEHESTKIYYTHGGGSSANEGLFHGKLIIAMGIFFDQIANTTKLAAGGSAESLDKFTFTSTELCEKIQLLIEDKTGNFSRNCERLKRIARIAARRKYLGADLIEEVLYDSEMRFVKGKEVRPKHLQTADMRMPAYKARNWDLIAVSVLGTGVFVGSAWFIGKLVWVHRGLIHRFVASLR